MAAEMAELKDLVVCFRQKQLFFFNLSASHCLHRNPNRRPPLRVEGIQIPRCCTTCSVVKMKIVETKLQPLVIATKIRNRGWALPLPLLSQPLALVEVNEMMRVTQSDFE